MKNIIIMTIKLLVITIVAGIVLGVVNAVTKDPIAEQQRIAADDARKAAFLDAASFEAMDIDIPEEYAIIQNVYTAFDANGDNIGIVAEVKTKGYSAGLNLTIGIGADGVIKGAIVGDHQETPGLGAKATEPWFQAQYKNKPYDNPLVVVKTPATDTYDIQAIASATITSNGVTDAVNIATKFYSDVIGGAQ